MNTIHLRFREESSFLKQADQLGQALSEMERHGAAPVCSDGKIGGNGSVAIVGTTQVRVDLCA